MSDVRVVAVSHSAALAEGVVELARQMAPDVDLVAAGGDDDGALGTSFERIAAALADPPAGGVVVLYDLGSALLTTETAVEFLDDPDTVTVADAPLVEGALAAAVAAQGGAERADVAAAAVAAGGPANGSPAGSAADGGPAVADAGAERRRATLVNRLGLHARPAARLAAALAGLDATVRVGPADGPAVDVRRVLDVVGLGLRGGTEVSVAAEGPDAAGAADRAVELLASGFGESDDLSPRVAANPADSTTTPGDRSRAGAPGQALGPLVHAGEVVLPPPGRVGDVAAERAGLAAAVDRAARALRGGDAMSRLHAALLDDPGLRDAADAAVAADRPAPRAWWTAVEQVAGRLAGGDELVAARAADVRDAGAAVLRELGVPVERVPPDVAGCVLAADDLGPGEVTTFAARGGVGVVLGAGSPTAHAVVVARGLGLPVVLRAGDRLAGVTAGTVVALDGDTGEVVVDPPDAAERRAAADAAAQARQRELADAAAPVHVDGRRVLVAANVGSLAEARAAVTHGADAVGLLRTELLVLDRPTLPGEDEQMADLRAILDAVGDRRVVVRVLDAGGDKPVRALHLEPLRNGFLGIRGLRWLLTEPAVLRSQLRAICRAGAGHDVAVLAPMVTVADEARAFRAAVDGAVASLAADGLPHTVPIVGAMIEVPAAALAADEIADAVDFVSIGTNDLASYVLAADRTEPGVAHLLDPHATALWRAIEQTCALAAGRAPVAVCGELAADPEFAARLVGLGVEELSMAPAAIPAVKRALRAPGGR